jgi:glycosyltransferase involved in cell wall biosynthesis
VSAKKQIVLMNLPDPKRFQLEPRCPQASGPSKFRLVYFGTITRRLGIDLAIRAMHMVRDRIPDVELHVLGSGEDRDEFLALSRELGLNGAVKFSDGFLSFDELIPRVRSMDAVVIPNRRNDATELMLPVKMMEGLALGLTAIAPRLKAIEHYFSEDELFYFEPDDAGSLGEAIVSASRSVEAARNGVNGHRFCDRFSWDVQKTDLIEMYRSLAPSR